MQTLDDCELTLVETRCLRTTRASEAEEALQTARYCERGKGTQFIMIEKKIPSLFC